MQPDERNLSVFERIHTLTIQDVIEIAQAPIGVIQQWSPIVTTRIVLTGERYIHILEQHPELDGREDEILHTLAQPDEIHRNARDVQMAILYRSLGEDGWIRVALWISNVPHLQNSIHSARMAPDRERRKGRERNRLVWER